MNNGSLDYHHHYELVVNTVPANRWYEQDDLYFHYHFEQVASIASCNLKCMKDNLNCDNHFEQVACRLWYCGLYRLAQPD